VLWSPSSRARSRSFRTRWWTMTLRSNFSRTSSTTFSLTSQG
jgi:hypothetical protein